MPLTYVVGSVCSEIPKEYLEKFTSLSAPVHISLPFKTSCHSLIEAVVTSGTVSVCPLQVYIRVLFPLCCGFFLCMRVVFSRYQTLSPWFSCVTDKEHPRCLLYFISSFFLIWCQSFNINWPFYFTTEQRESPKSLSKLLILHRKSQAESGQEHGCLAPGFCSFWVVDAGSVLGISV